MPSAGTFPSRKYASTVDVTQLLTPYAPCPSPLLDTSTPTPLPSSSAIRRAPSYGVAGSPVVPTTRIGPAPGALASGVSCSPSTGQPEHQPAVSQARNGPKTGDSFSKSGSSALASAAVGLALPSAQEMARCEWFWVS